MAATQSSAVYPDPFHIQVNAIPSLRNVVLRFAAPAIEWLLAFPQMNHLHRQINTLRTGQSFSERSLASLDVKLRINDTDLSHIPASGPLIVVANHPFGAIDGLALMALIKRRRPDVKMLANFILRAVPELAEDCLFVDPFGGESAKQRNISGIRAALRWVRDGGALAVFPAGEVSSLNVKQQTVSDGQWSRQVGALVRHTGAAVVPVFFAGRNSNAFQCAGLISPRLRTLMLPRELLKRRGSTIHAEIGSLLSAEKLRRFETDLELADYLRVRTYMLAARRQQTQTRREMPTAQEPVASAQSADHLKSEIDRLPADRCLGNSGHLKVVYGSASEFPFVMQEIGRLRELTFRRVGEGTGRSADLDQFDQTYLHLFVWNDSACEIVGAYRMGLTDQILAISGPAGLYTNTLFRYRKELLIQLGPAIELGRSFVRIEYQKEFSPLMLLWRGIATFAARNPQYRMLFGPVSISNDYHSLSRQLLIEFLQHNNTSEKLKKLVNPRNPPRFGPGRNWEARLAGTIVRSIDAIDELVGEIETDRMGMPVLLRQYLKLNAKLLGFNVDPDFGDVLDGLMLVDLTKVQRAILVRYMGRGEAAQFLEHHGCKL
jgi:putative hemolysin